MRIRQVYDHYDHDQVGPEAFKYCPYCGDRLTVAESGLLLRPTCRACGFVQFKNPAPTVSILIVEGNRVLLGKRSGNPGKGTWAIPSGYVEYQDSFLETAVREAKEETGLDVEIHSIINVVSSFTSPWYHFLGIYVSAIVLGGTAVPGDDLDDVAWFPLSGPLPEMGFQEDRDIIALYANRPAQGLPVDPDHARPDIDP